MRFKPKASPLQCTKALKVVLSDGTDEFAPSIAPDPIDCADEGVKSSALHCASASVSSDVLKIDVPVCCVIAVGLPITSASGSSSPRHKTKNDDKTGCISMLGIQSIESTRKTDMMPKVEEEDKGLPLRAQEYHSQ